MMKDIRNIGIFAHVDAGKTTLTERFLAHAGAIRTVGSVDSGTAHTDTLPVERQRGISVKATCVSFTYGDTLFHLIDTPGHADFSAEVERALWALDCAVLLVSAVEGVQPQTEVLFRAMQEQKLPVVIFVNKTDRAGADVAAVLAQLKQYFSQNVVSLDDADALAELLAEEDEDFFERFVDGEVFAKEALIQMLQPAFQSGRCYPVLSGSALRDEGVDELLDAIVACMPAPSPAPSLSGVVFAIQQDRAMGRGVWVRLYGGALENRTPLKLPDGTDPLTRAQQVKEWKVTQILDPSGRPTGKLRAGEIGIVFGLGNVPVGQILGEESALPRRVSPGRLREPLIRVQVIPSDPSRLQALHQACQQLSDEDPLLEVQFIRELGQLHLRVMGTIQLEILQELLKDRFGLDVHFGEPAIIYKETIRCSGEGFVAYTMPKPCWAILKFRLEPGERGSGVQFHSQVPVRELAQHYQNQVLQALPTALRQGRLGWEVTDVKVTLLEGDSHQYHTHPLDFIVATPMGIQDGLQRCGNVLLEPIVQVRFQLPRECVGRLIQDVTMMEGEVLTAEGDDLRMTVRALLPLRTSLDYAVTLATFTGGRGSMSVALHSYRECPPDITATAPRRGVDPLDTSKYILAARSALDGNIFDT